MFAREGGFVLKPGTWYAGVCVFSFPSIVFVLLSRFPSVGETHIRGHNQAATPPTQYGMVRALFL